MMTFAAAAQRWLDECGPEHSAEWQVKCGQYVKRIVEHFGEVPLDQVDRGRLVQFRNELLARELANSTVNHYLATCKQILRECLERREIDRVPRLRALTPNKRLRWLTRADAGRLLDQLPPHQREMAVFALETGLRRSNVCKLQWVHVDLSARLLSLPGDMMKNGAALCVPLSAGALQILRSRRGIDDRYVFTWRGRPMTRKLCPTWYRALGRAGIQDMRWHDLRHTWASWHAQRGTPLLALQQLGGWKTSSMVSRYAHMNADHLRTWVR